MKLYFMLTILDYVGAIILSNRNLTDVPSDIPSTEKLVDLQNNKITVIRVNAFVALTDLRDLRLQNNVIELIEPGGFNGLQKVTSLKLWGNKLSSFLNSSTLSGLSALQDLNIGSNKFGSIDSMQLEVLGNLVNLILNWIIPNEISAFPNMLKLRHINLRGNRMVTFSSKILKRLSGLEILRLGYNKFSFLPELGGVEGQIIELDLKRNRFTQVPDLRKYVNLTTLDLSDNYITLVPEESLAAIQSGTVNLEGNTVTCVSELCWLVSESWPFEVQLTCPDGEAWANVNQTVICEGRAASAKQLFSMCTFLSILY